MDRRRWRGGFTLVEMMLVVLLMGILATATVVNLRDRQDAYALSASARDLASALRFAATQARLEGVGYRVVCEHEGRGYRVETRGEGQGEYVPAAGLAGTGRLLARGARMSGVRQQDDAVEAMPEAIEFGPDGRGFWGVIELESRAGQGVEIRVMPWTGQVWVEEARRRIQGRRGREAREERRGFTLLEVLVAVMALAVGVIGALSALSMGLRAAAHGEHLGEAVRIARNEMELALAASAGQLQPQSAMAGRYKWTLSYAEKPEGIVQADVTVEWVESGEPQVYRLSQLFLPQPKN